MTKKDIIARLEELGVSVKKHASIKELETLLAKAESEHQEQAKLEAEKPEQKKTTSTSVSDLRVQIQVMCCSHFLACKYGAHNNVVAVLTDGTKNYKIKLSPRAKTNRILVRCSKNLIDLLSIPESDYVFHEKWTAKYELNMTLGELVQKFREVTNQ